MSATSWAQERERGSDWALKSLFWALNIFGYNVARVLLRPIVAYFVLTGGRSRRASRQYLTNLNSFDTSAPAPSFREVYKHHLEFAETLLERVQLWQGKLEHFKFAGEGREILETRRETGCVLLGAHFGSFDALRIVAQGLDCRINVVMYRAHATRINKFLEKLNPQTNLRVVELSPGDTEGVLNLKKRIESGEHVALLADRLPPGSKKRTSSAGFLGANALFPETPWLLAGILACPIIFVAAVRVAPRSYRIYVESVAEKLQTNRAIIKSHIQGYACRLESLCVQHPQQWFNFYDFWAPDESGE